MGRCRDEHVGQSLPVSGTEPDPLTEVVELLARRHALALVRALGGRSTGFRELARSLGAAEPVASQRLRELRGAGIVEVSEAGDYRLTNHGRRLLGALDALAAVAARLVELTPRQRSPRGAAEQGRGET